jgi:hypothetical protein
MEHVATVSRDVPQNALRYLTWICQRCLTIVEFIFFVLAAGIEQNTCLKMKAICVMWPGRLLLIAHSSWEYDDKSIFIESFHARITQFHVQ